MSSKNDNIKKELYSIIAYIEKKIVKITSKVKRKLLSQQVELVVLNKIKLKKNMSKIEEDKEEDDVSLSPSECNVSPSAYPTYHPIEEWFSENLRIIVAVIIVGVIAVGVYLSK